MVRKIDPHLITSLFGIFVFNILDRSNIASARLGGLQTDLNLTDAQYQTAVLLESAFVAVLGQLLESPEMSFHKKNYLDSSEIQ